MTEPPRKPGRPKGSKNKPPPKSKNAPRGLKTLHQAEKAGKFAPRANYKTRGAPKVYQPIFAEQAKELYQAGATNMEVADFFNVSIATIQKWLIQIPEFRFSSYIGRDAANKRVEASLYNRAIGYSYEAEKIVVDGKSGKTTRVQYIEHVPPDPGAAMKWLTNRDTENWRERTETKVSAEITLLDLVRASFEAPEPAKEIAPPAEDKEE